MTNFTKGIASLMIGSAVGLPYLASTGGWGIGSERDAKIVQEMQKNCPPNMRRSNGTCIRTHRGYYYGRSFYGGGPRGGK